MKNILPTITILTLLNTGSFSKEPIEIFDKPTGLVDIWDDKPDRSDMAPNHPINIDDLPGEPKKPIELFDKKGDITPWAGLWKVKQNPVTTKGACMGVGAGISAELTGLPDTVTIQDVFHPSQIIDSSSTQLSGKWKKISSTQWTAPGQFANTKMIQVKFVWGVKIRSKKKMTLKLSLSVKMNVPGMGLKKCTIIKAATLTYMR